MADDAKPGDDSGLEPRPAEGGPVRCHCGAMLARLVPGGVELKCRRCRRTQLVPLVSHFD